MEQAHLLNSVRTSHWLEQGGSRREGGGERRARQREGKILKRRFTFFLSLPISSLPSLGGCERAEQRGRHKVRETKGAKQREWKRVCVWVTLCVTCSVMLVWLPLPLQPASLAVRKRNVFRWNESLSRFTMWMWDSNFQTFAGRIPRKKEQGPESRAGPAGWPPVSLYCWDSLA